MVENEQDYKDKMFELIKLEYNAMREEINNAHSHIFTTMDISLVAAGALSSIIYNYKNELIIIHFFLLLLFPWISVYAVLTILAESQRLKRAGDYICFLEEKVRLLCTTTDSLQKQYIEVWDNKQKVIEDWLNIKHSNLKLSSPLCFERWIRDLEILKSSYGRSNVFFIARFACIYIAIPFFSIIVSIFMQLREPIINWCVYGAIIVVESVVFIVLGYKSYKICFENRVAYKIEKRIYVKLKKEYMQP